MTMVTCISLPTYTAKKCRITVNPISVRVKTNYDFEVSGARSISDPCADDNIKETLTSLQNLKLDRRDCVILHLMNNSVPVTQSDEFRTPEITSPPANRTFHLIGKVDREMMHIPELPEIAFLLNKISGAVETVSKTRAVCISLGVSAKFQVACCKNPNHGLAIRRLRQC